MCDAKMYAGSNYFYGTALKHLLQCQ